MDWSLQIAARTLWMEARGEPEDGQRAVAHVFVNRLHSGRWGHILAEVCLYPFAFSCWNPKDPNRMAAARLPDDDPHLAKLVTILRSALSGEDDPTGGATHYYADTMESEPSWSVGATFCGQFGHHRFYKNIH